MKFWHNWLAKQQRGGAYPVRAMKTIAVNLGPTLNERSYPIHVGSNLLSQPEFILPHLVQQRVAIISNSTVAPLYMEKLRSKLEGKGRRVVPDYSSRRGRIQKLANTEPDIRRSPGESM